jgi:hypothetical protein
MYGALLIFLFHWYRWILPIITVFLFIFYFTKKYKPFYITTILLLIFNLNFLVSIPMYMRDIFLFFNPLNLSFVWDQFLFFLISLWAIKRAFNDFIIVVKGESVVDQWNMIIEQAAGKSQQLLNTAEGFIKDARIPNTACFQDLVSTSLFGQKRQFLMFYNLMHQDYKMYISARNIGTHLDVSWFATIEPRLLKRTLSKYMMGDPQALSQQVDMFDQQDLRACFTVAHHCLQQAIDVLLEELKQQPLGVRGAPQSKGFLSVW